MSRDWTFETGKNGFSYEDDLFGDGPSGRFAHGKYKEAGGEDGALLVRLGGENDKDAEDLSGGWTKSFKLNAEARAEVTIRFKLQASDQLDSDEYGELRLALDGEAHGKGGKDHLARLHGDDDPSTGWQEVTISLGKLEAGRHDLDLGGYLNAKSAKNEKIKILIDEVSLDLKPTGDDDDGNLAAFEAEVLTLTNDFRAENGLDPLEADAKLSAAAEDWSREMAEEDIFRHSDTPAQVAAEGYDWQALGENIAAGYPTPEEVVEGWIDSPGHRANLLSENFEEIGIGHVFREDDGGDAPYGHYWTQIFGTEADSLV
jgi:uncharacterized protein YkwD